LTGVKVKKKIRRLFLDAFTSQNKYPVIGGKADKINLRQYLCFGSTTEPRKNSEEFILESSVNTKQ
jgi:hypothetical protein